jgi:tetratricopeptide (TPR) repeat protein
LGRVEDAIPPLKRAIELKPECLESHDYLGMAYLKRGNREGAMEQLAMLKRLDPKFEGELSKQFASDNLRDE